MTYRITSAEFCFKNNVVAGTEIGLELHCFLRWFHNNDCVYILWSSNPRL